MIEYQETKKIKIHNLKQFIKFRYKPLFIGAILAFLIAIYFFIIGFVVDKDALSYGVPILIIDVITVVSVPLGAYYRGYKILIYPIEDETDTYIENHTIEYRDENYTFSNTTKGNVSSLNKKELLSAEVYKDIIVIWIIGKQYKLIPNTEETKAMFTNLISNDK